jgi:hypothetical protein
MDTQPITPRWAASRCRWASAWIAAVWKSSNSFSASILAVAASNQVAEVTPSPLSAPPRASRSSSATRANEGSACTRRHCARTSAPAERWKVVRYACWPATMAN